jgi:hypothetical protein
LARPFFRRIDPTNEVLSVNIFVVWTLYAKIILDLDDRKRFGLHENPARLVEKLVENIIKSLTDDEILAIFSSYEFSTIVRIYIRLHIGQNKIRAIEARKRISRELVWEMVEDSMSEYHRRVRLEYSELRRSKFNVHVVQSFVRLLQSSSMIPSMTLRQWGSKHQIQDLKDQIEAQQLDIQGSFPFIASNVLMELQNLVSVFFSVDHHFEIDLNELTFLVIWTATYNVRCKRHRLIVRSKPWLEQSDWSEQQLLRSASPELILFFATFAKLNEGISLMMVFKWFSDKKRRLRPD